MILRILARTLLLTSPLLVGAATAFSFICIHTGVETVTFDGFLLSLGMGVTFSLAFSFVRAIVQDRKQSIKIAEAYNEYAR